MVVVACSTQRCAQQEDGLFMNDAAVAGPATCGGACSWPDVLLLDDQQVGLFSRPDVGVACCCDEACSRPDVFGAVWSAVWVVVARRNSSNWWRQHWWPRLSTTQHDFNNTGHLEWVEEAATMEDIQQESECNNNNHSKRIPN
uniref:Uncharacterized protein n=1 Tax=Meloidogyne incognita TaxID=6306 RepID=A0A914LYF8_MELIC